MDKLNDVTNSYKKNSTFYILSLFFQEHIHEIPYITMDEVAIRTFVSKSQISKYVRYLDYKTYIDFKDACLEYLESLERRRHDFDVYDNMKDNILNFTNTMIYFLNSLTNSLDYNRLELLIKQLTSANTIYPRFPKNYNVVGGTTPKVLYNCDCFFVISPTRTALPGFSNASMTSNSSSNSCIV